MNIRATRGTAAHTHSDRRVSRREKQTLEDEILTAGGGGLCLVSGGLGLWLHVDEVVPSSYP